MVRPGEVRRVEVGFRTIPGSFEEPPAYEWNVQHRGGRLERRADEATVFTGDENLADVNLVLQYRVSDPTAALVTVGQFTSAGASKWDTLVRAVAEAALREVMSGRSIDSVLSDERSEIEVALHMRIAVALLGYGTGFSVDRVCLGDVHPPVEVVSEFREVVEAREEKEAKINQAEAYQYERQALARGKSQQTVLAAEASGAGRTHESRGRADRFAALARACSERPELTRLRLYLQTVERTLAGRKKVILDSVPDGARRQLFLGRTGLLGALPKTPTEELQPNTQAEEYPEP